MSATNLPPEILREIFTNLIVNDAIKCRAVCKAWKAAVDDLSDAQWNKICEREYMYSMFKKIHDKSGITWRETYKAIYSWDRIKSAKMECRPLPARFTQQFKVLPNRKIALLTSSKRDSLGDTIVYYDIDTLKEIGRKKYEKTFHNFDENEHLIVLVSKTYELILIQKANDKVEVVAKVYNVEPMRCGHFGLFGKSVYFQHEGDGQIYLSTLKETNTGNTIIKTAQLNNFELYPGFVDNVCAFGWMDDCELMTILTDYGRIYGYDHETDELGTIANIWQSTDKVSDVIFWGFDWTAPTVYAWLICSFVDYTIERNRIAAYGPLVLFDVTEQRLADWFLHPITPDALEDATPTRTEKQKFAKMSKDGFPMCQMDVLESADSHLVVVRTWERVFLLKFGFDAAEGTTEEREVLIMTNKRAAAKQSQMKLKTTASHNKSEGDKTLTKTKTEYKKSLPKLKAANTIQTKDDVKEQQLSTKKDAPTKSQPKSKTKQSEIEIEQKISMKRKADSKPSVTKSKAKKVINKPKGNIQKSHESKHKYNTRSSKKC